MQIRNSRVKHFMSNNIITSRKKIPIIPEGRVQVTVASDLWAPMNHSLSLTGEGREKEEDPQPSSRLKDSLPIPFMQKPRQFHVAVQRIALEASSTWSRRERSAVETDTADGILLCKRSAVENPCSIVSRTTCTGERWKIWALRRSTARISLEYSRCLTIHWSVPLTLHITFHIVFYINIFRTFSSFTRLLIHSVQKFNEANCLFVCRLKNHRPTLLEETLLRHSSFNARVVTVVRMTNSEFPIEILYIYDSLFLGDSNDFY